MGTNYTVTATENFTLASASPIPTMKWAGLASDLATLTATPVGGGKVLLSASETVTFTPTQLANILTALSITELLSIEDTHEGAKLCALSLSENVHLSSVSSGNALLNLLASETLSFVLVLDVSGERYVVWAANADTFAHSRYENFNFNSMCRIGDRYYGAGEAGIYALDATSDAGEPIRFFASMPTTDLGDSHGKRLPKVYLGFKSDGPMYLQVQTEDGKRRIYLFNKKSEQMAGSGATLGRGVKSRYWTFDLMNGDGASAVIDQVEFFPIVLIRRINS